jgi:hypothetical protein
MPSRNDRRKYTLYLVAGMTVGSVNAHAQSDDLSPYVRLLIGYAGSAATAVACGDRSELWGVSVHTQILNIITRHAGSPIQNSHTPTADERTAAVAALVKSEDAGTRQGSRPAACRVVRTLYLDELDQFEVGHKSFWPTSLVPDMEYDDRPAMI